MRHDPKKMTKIVRGDKIGRLFWKVIEQMVENSAVIDSEQARMQKDILTYLGMWHNISKNPDIPYGNLAGFILHEGRFWTPSPLPSKIPKGKAKQCFNNAHDLALKRGLTYVEGYAMRIIPIEHAWCVDPKTGEVIDNTWSDPETASYFGVPFKTDFVTDTVVHQGYYGILGNPRLCHGLITGDITGWRHEIA